MALAFIAKICVTAAGQRLWRPASTVVGVGIHMLQWLATTAVWTAQHCLDAVLYTSSAAALPANLLHLSLDTGRLNTETYQLFDAVEKHYGIRIEYTFPDAQETMDLVRSKGMFSFYEDGHQECCRVRKVRRVCSQRLFIPVGVPGTWQRVFLPVSSRTNVGQLLLRLLQHSVVHSQCLDAATGYDSSSLWCCYCEVLGMTAHPALLADAICIMPCSYPSQGFCCPVVVMWFAVHVPGCRLGWSARQHR